MKDSNKYIVKSFIYKKYVTKAAIIAMTIMSVMGMTGCGEKASEKAVYDEVVDSLIDNGQSENAVVVSASDDYMITTLDVNDMFTTRDLGGEYDESECEEITLLETTAESASIGVSVNGGIITVSKEGVYILRGELNDGTVIVDVDDSQKVQLVLDGAKIYSSSSAAIYVKNADKVFITLAEDSENILYSEGEYVAIDDSNIDSVIFAKDDLTLNGRGTLIVNSSFGHGIVCKNDLVITGGIYSIDSAKHGLSGKDSVRISGGSFNIKCGEDAVHSGNDEEEKGFVYIEGGDFSIDAADDGIHADYELLISGGNINITNSYEGLEGRQIEIRGGHIEVCSKDDGFNAAGGTDNSAGWMNPFADESDKFINIAGGYTHINAEGDGIDSNGSLYVSGGEVYVDGPVNSGNGPLDYNGTARITGGIVVAVGARGMDQNFDETSTQGSILVNSNETESDDAKIVLQDSDGNDLLAFQPLKKYSSILISCPQVEVGETYKIILGESEMEITMDSLIYGNGSMMGGFGGGRPGMDGSKGDRGNMKNFEGEPGEMEGFEGDRGGMGGPKGEPGDMESFEGGGPDMGDL